MKLGVTKPIATIWYVHHLKIMNMKSLSGPLKSGFVKQRLYEKPGGKVGLRPREECEEDHFWKSVFKK